MNAGCKQYIALNNIRLHGVVFLNDVTPLILEPHTKAEHTVCYFYHGKNFSNDISVSYSCTATPTNKESEADFMHRYDVNL